MIHSESRPACITNFLGHPRQRKTRYYRCSTDGGGWVWMAV